MRVRIGFIVVAVTIATLPAMVTGPVEEATGAPTTCVASQVSISATVDRDRYASGVPVHVTVTLANRSSRSCSYATGPSSPNYRVINGIGATVWGSCWVSGAPSPCADFLVQRTLPSRARYVERLSWGQRTGSPDVPVPAGRYRFLVTMAGQRAETSFALSGSVAVTLADANRRYTLGLGAQLSVRLPVTGLLRWTSAQSSDPAVMALVVPASVVPGVTVFRALHWGVTRISATGNPVCYPQCLMPSRDFSITVDVRAP